MLHITVNLQVTGNIKTGMFAVALEEFGQFLAQLVNVHQVNNLILDFKTTNCCYKMGA